MKSEKLKVNRRNRNESRPGYKKTKVGWIPEEWGITPLKEVAKLERGRFSARPRNDPRYYGGTIPFVQTGDISSANLYIQTHSQTLNQAGLTVSKIFPKGTILMTIAANIGDVAISKYELACPDSLVGINGNQNVNQLWLFHYLSTQKLNLEVQAPQNAQKNINLEILGAHPIPVPPIPEQKKIAEILSAWDRAIEITNRLITNYELLKKGLMQQLLTGRMRFPEFNHEIHENKKGELSEGWKIKRLGSLGSFLRGKGISNSEKTETGIPCITYGEIYTRHEFVIKDFYSFIDSGTTQKSQRIKRNDILFAGSGETLDEIGKCVAHTKDIEAYAGGDIVIFRSKGVNPFYFSYSLNSDLLIRQKRKLGQGHSVVHIYSAGLKTLQVPLPSFEEQTRIAAVLSTCDREIELLKKKQENLKGQKKGLMQKLLTGEIRHPEFLKFEERSVKCERNG